MFGGRFSFADYPEAQQAASEAYGALETAVSLCGVRATERIKAVAYVAWVALHGLVDLHSRVKLRSPESTATDDEIVEEVIKMILAHVELQARA
jgi:hypothetical protein